MKIQRVLWLIAGILLVIILVERPGEKKIEKLQDGTYRNVYLISLKEEQMIVLINNKQWTIYCPVGKEVEKANQIVDIVVEKNKIRGISWKEGQISKQVEAIDRVNGWIRFAGSQTLPLAAEWKAYQWKNNGVTEIKETGSLINWKEVLVTAIGGKVQAVVAVRESETKDIKVLIHGNKDGIYHNEVRLTASADYEVTENETTSSRLAGTEFVLSGEESGDYKITCREGRIRLLSLNGAFRFPEYRGEIRIRKEAEGYVVRNELLLEEYLYSVVSSEMPATYPKEALNAQAVCARTYALYQMNKSYYSPYGANVDDTVNSQVYNNVAETKESKKAVKTTREQYLEYEETPIAAYFYSTSCGSTSDAADVWVGEGKSPRYLKGHFQGEGEKINDLSKEKAFQIFMESEEDCFEKGEAWYRWKTSISMKELTNHLNRNLSEWRKNNPSHYLIRADGNALKKGNSIGKLKHIKVVDRSKGGVIRKLEVTGTEGVLTIIGEYQIRKILCPENTEVILRDGSLQTCSMLPSAYLIPEVREEKLVIRGGGYGHGVGLSQNGAKAMANRNYTYEDILNFYYPGVTLVYGY